MPLGTGINAVGQHELTLNTHTRDFRRKLRFDPTLLCVLCAHAGNIFATVFVQEKLFKKFRQMVAGPGKAPGKLSQSCWSPNAGAGKGGLGYPRPEEGSWERCTLGTGATDPWAAEGGREPGREGGGGGAARAPDE